MSGTNGSAMNASGKMMAGRLLVKVYRSPGNEGMYLYVASADALTQVPAALLAHFGTPKLAMTLLLAPNRPLARADVQEVMAAIEERGYYLQMAPGEDSAEMAAIAARNDKLQKPN